MYPWFKYAFRRHLYKNYTWLYTNFRNTGSRIFFIDLVNYGYAIIESINLLSSVTCPVMPATSTDIGSKNRYLQPIPLTMYWILFTTISMSATPLVSYTWT